MTTTWTPETLAPPRAHLGALRAAAAGVQAGHRLDLLFDSHDAWRILQADLERAIHSLDIEMYMLVEDSVGQAFIAALVTAVRRGVRVRLVLDAIGSMRLPMDRRLEIIRAGVELRLYHAPLLHRPWTRWTHRDHRKTVLVDGRVGFVLGMNMGREYFALGPGGLTWADAGVRVDGPLVGQLIEAFESSWQEARSEQDNLPALPNPPRIATLHAGIGKATAVFNGGLGRAEVHRRYLYAIRSARQRIWLAHSYFLPTARLQRALCQAARRGVDVRVLVPDLWQNDILAVSLAVDHAVGKLLARGVRVFAFEKRMMHAKFAVVDDVWWTLGSANLDELSRSCNLETNVVGMGETEATQLAGYFDQLLVETRELTFESWRRRPWWQKAVAHGAWHLRAWL